MSSHGVGRADHRGDGAPSSRAGSGSAPSRSGCTARSRPRPARRVARLGPQHLRAGPHQRAGIARRAALPRRRRLTDPSIRGREPRGTAARQRGTLRAVVEGVHASDGRGCLRRPGNRKPSQPLHDRYRRRRLRDQPVYDPTYDIEAAGTVRAVFFGLGSDGTVGANKNTIKILGERLFAQGYFVYDSKKSGSQTVSHLRFGPDPIRAAYLVSNAGFVGCHQLELHRACRRARPRGHRCHPPAELPAPRRAGLGRPPRHVQEQILAKNIELYAIDANRIAREVDLAGRTNTVLQTCFFAISGVLPREEAMPASRNPSTRPTGRGETSCAVTWRPSTAPCPGCIAYGSGPGDLHARVAARWSRPRA